MNSKLESKLISALQNLLLLGLLFYIAWISSQGIWAVLEGQDGSAMVLSEQKSVVSGSSNSVKMRDVARYHLFGKEGKVELAKKEAPKEAPKTRLRLTLRGVFTAEQAQDSGAIVEEQGKTSNYYKVGDALPGGATLESVFSDRILLRRSGKLEALYFDESTGGDSNKIAASPKKQSKPERSTKIDSPEQFVQEATKRLAENPEQALRSVGLSASADGGYVYQGNNPMLSGLNLEKGDVIRSVNGHSLGDVQKDKSLMQSLYEQGNLEVEVVRDGTSFYINYPLR